MKYVLYLIVVIFLLFCYYQFNLNDREWKRCEKLCLRICPLEMMEEEILKINLFTRRQQEILADKEVVVIGPVVTELQTTTNTDAAFLSYSIFFFHKGDCRGIHD